MTQSRNRSWQVLAALAVAAVCSRLTGGGAMAQADAAPQPEAARDPVSVMTFNIRYNNPGDGENAWPHRRDWVAEIIRKQEADVVGCQEALRDQIADLEERLPGYAWYGVGRDDGQQRGEFVPVFYRTSRFELLEKSSFWLSETPDRPGSRGWDASLPRVTTVLRLKDRSSGQTLLVVNTHFDHRGAQSRAMSAALVLKEIARRRREREAVVFMGDLNCEPDSRPYATLTARDAGAAVHLLDARAVSRTAPAGPLSTWNGFERIVPDRRIDYLFVAGPVSVESYRTIDDTRDGRFPSDHLPVIAELSFEEASPADGSANQSTARPRTVPDKVVVLTFDDAVKSHFTVVRPLLLKHGFGATFFVTEGFDFKTNKEQYLAWEEIARLDADGFEIGNHTGGHVALNPKKPETLAGLREQIQAINHRCDEYGVPRPVSFAYPGNQFDVQALPVLEELGLRLARRGGEPEYVYRDGRGCGYQPGLDHPLLIPSAGDARPHWTLADFQRAIEQASHGRIAVVQFHGVPDVAHPWVNTPVERFEEYLQFLADGGYTVIALRDVEQYVDPELRPSDPLGAIRDRQQRIAAGKDHVEDRPPKDDEDLRGWLENMVWHHRFTPAEIRAATGLNPGEIAAALEQFQISPGTQPPRPADAPLLVLPYPGGRHPRRGFLDGAIRPQRETKVSVFLPWDPASYVVLDVPEAIRRENDARTGLLYLAHTHVDTMWTKQGLELEPLEWQRQPDGALLMERRLPNGVAFGTSVRPGRDAVRMEMWLDNGSDETFRGLRVQNCVMLAGAPEFAAATGDDRVIREPYIACRSRGGNRWVITAWSGCQRAWANPPCPCIHSDPAFPDVMPGDTHRLRGWLSFYEGDDLDGELQRIEATAWSRSVR